MKEENISKVNKLIELSNLVKEHRDKKFCNWHKVDQDDFIAGYYNLEHMQLRVLYKNEELDKENKRLKKEIDDRVEKRTKYEVSKAKANCRNAIAIAKIFKEENEQLKLRIEKLNKYNKFEIMDI